MAQAFMDWAHRGFEEVICDHADRCTKEECRYRTPIEAPVMYNASCGTMGFISVIPYKETTNPNTLFRRKKNGL